MPDGGGFEEDVGLANEPDTSSQVASPAGGPSEAPAGTEAPGDVLAGEDATSSPAGDDAVAAPADEAAAPTASITPGNDPSPAEAAGDASSAPAAEAGAADAAPAAEASA